MKRKPISRSILSKMIKQLAELEEQKSLILDKYYSEPSAKRDDFEKMVEKYTRYIETYLKNVSVVDKTDNGCPFVAIDSNVEVVDMEDKESYTFRVVSPLIDEAPADVDCVSYLSPIGKALLLKEINDELHIATPSEVLKYKVTGIWLMDA
jgi:transcription elongation factor GreA